MTPFHYMKRLLSYSEYACSLIGLHPTDIDGLVHAYIEPFGDIGARVVVMTSERLSSQFCCHPQRIESAFRGSFHYTSFGVRPDTWAEALRRRQAYEEQAAIGGALT